MDLYAKAAELGIQTGFHDGQGAWHTTDAAALEIILNALPVRAPVSSIMWLRCAPARAGGHN